MKNPIKLISLIFAIILVTACSKDNFETGIKGTVEYGQGDCMPIIDYQSREYDNYNGKLFFVIKEDLDSLYNGDFEQLKSNSINIRIKRGKLSVELAAGTYLVMTEDAYLYSDENTVTINSGELLNKDFRFWKCTSY